jgi:hypothetical protein
MGTPNSMRVLYITSFLTESWAFLKSMMYCLIVLAFLTSIGRMQNNLSVIDLFDRLCGLVVRVLGYRSGGPVSIPGTTRKKQKCSGSGTGYTQPREYKLRSYLIEK